MSVSAPIVEAVREADLVYTSDAGPGITRRRVGDDFEYHDPKGRRIEDVETIERIRSLAIPPAYERVWICPDPNGHLQATGFDARGRKQYRYHPRFREVRDEAKFSRMVSFGKRLRRVRERVDHDLSLKGLPREKVLAAIVHLLEHSLIRVGNEEYAKENKSYGLTTMRSRHVRVGGSEVEFRFVGKSKVKHDVKLHDRRLARVVKRLQELPGQELFQYVDDEGQIRSVTSQDVNDYLKEISNAPFTAKDFRTWAATVLCMTSLAVEEAPQTKKQAKSTVAAVLREVSGRLGNTPAVCRKSYVHPAVLDSYLDGTLRRIVAKKADVETVLEDAESAVLRLLRRFQSETH